MKVQVGQLWKDISIHHHCVPVVFILTNCLTGINNYDDAVCLVQGVTRARGVAPSSDCTLTAAPAASSRFTTSTLLLAQAECRIVRPSLVLADTMSCTTDMQRLCTLDCSSPGQGCTTVVLLCLNAESNPVQPYCQTTLLHITGGRDPKEQQESTWSFHESNE